MSPRWLHSWVPHYLQILRGLPADTCSSHPELGYGNTGVEALKAELVDRSRDRRRYQRGRTVTEGQPEQRLHASLDYKLVPMSASEHLKKAQELLE